MQITGISMAKIDYTKLAISIIVCQVAGLIGSLVTFNSITTWYETLNKPIFAPPNWFFGPVWITLYFLMGISLYLVWSKGLDDRSVKIGIALFAIQLFLNAIWSPIFFGLHALQLSFNVIIIMWLFIMLTIVRFHSISKPASYLLIPYIGWVTIAAALNYFIWTMNI
jgi:tryptophan-rich sensory protein